MNKRFKLVFLGENEDYLADYGCTVDVVRAPTTPPSSDWTDGMSKLFRSGEFRGRIRIGSSALYLDLDGFSEFFKLPLTDILDVTGVSSKSVRMNARVMASIPIANIGSKSRLFRETIVYENANSEFFQLTISVHPTHLPDILSLLHHLRSSDHESRSAYIASFLAKDATQFDLTCLTSHRETLLLPGPMRVVRVKKMLEIHGLLQLSRQYVYFQATPSFGSKKVKRFPVANATVSAVKYKLRNTCVEISFENSERNLFIQFASRGDKDLFTSRLSDHIGSGAGVNDTTPPALSTVTELWRGNIISNFAYIQYLNFAAGRTVNDIGQYPVFPWTYVDMTSSVFDITDPSKFRDLSLPVAATNSARLAQCKDRATHMSPNERFLFGSFYSNPAFVLYFLLRKHPECYLRLHGGHFDHAARLFTSLKTAWEAVAETGSATMELIPEFYSEWDSAAAWLQNSPLLTQVPEVSLPPWAASPQDLIVKLRCALESPHVSSHLHEWIDLVFGVKSRGKQICLDNNNLFHPVCYLTDVDGDVLTYCKEQETKKEVVTLQSQEFGHIPKQLFLTEPHPTRQEMTNGDQRWKQEYYQTDIGRKSWRTEIAEAVATEKRNSSATVSKEESKVGAAAVAKVNRTHMVNSVKFDISKVSSISGRKWSDGTRLSVDGERVAVATSAGEVLFPNSREFNEWKLSTSPIVLSEWSGNTIFAGNSVTGHIYHLSSSNGLLRSSQPHLAGISSIALLSAELGVSGSDDQSVCVWSTDSLEPLAVFDGHSAPVVRVAVVPESRNFVSADSTGSVSLWEYSAIHGKSSPVWKSPSTGKSVTGLACSSETVVVVDTSGSLYLWDKAQGTLLWKHSLGDTHSRGMRYLPFLPFRADSFTVAVATHSAEAETVLDIFRLSDVNGVSQFNQIGHHAGLPAAKAVTSDNGALFVLPADGDQELIKVGLTL